MKKPYLNKKRIPNEYGFPFKIITFESNTLTHPFMQGLPFSPRCVLHSFKTGVPDDPLKVGEREMFSKVMFISGRNCQMLRA